MGNQGVTKHLVNFSLQTFVIHLNIQPMTGVMYRCTVVFQHNSCSFFAVMDAKNKVNVRVTEQSALMVTYLDALTV